MKTEWILYLTIIPAVVILSLNFASFALVLWTTMIKKRLSRKTKVKRKLVTML